MSSEISPVIEIFRNPFSLETDEKPNLDITETISESLTYSPCGLTRFTFSRKSDFISSSGNSIIIFEERFRKGKLTASIPLSCW